MNIKPLADRVLVLPAPAEEKVSKMSFSPFLISLSESFLLMRSIPP